MKYGTTVERKSERELIITRTINGPARIVFEAWTKPEPMRRWWTPKSDSTVSDRVSTCSVLQEAAVGHFSICGCPYYVIRVPV